MKSGAGGARLARESGRTIDALRPTGVSTQAAGVASHLQPHSRREVPSFSVHRTMTAPTTVWKLMASKQKDRRSRWNIDVTVALYEERHHRANVHHPVLLADTCARSCWPMPLAQFHVRLPKHPHDLFRAVSLRHLEPFLAISAFRILSLFLDPVSGRGSWRRCAAS